MPLRTLRNLFFILMLALGLATFLYFKPWNTPSYPEARIYDRLPKANLIGNTDLLKLSSSLSSTMFHYKIPFRDLLTPEFILSQGKNYGVDVQEPVFFFANEKENSINDWGLFFSVLDSSKIREGIIHLQKFIDVRTTKLHGETVFKSRAHNTYLIYGTDWLFIYGGNSFEEYFYKAIKAKRNEIDPAWRSFLNETSLQSHHLTARITHPTFNEYGISMGEFSVGNDSSSILLNSAIHFIDTIPFKLKSSGPSFYSQEFTRRLVNLHIEPEGINNPENIIYREVKNWGDRIAFPTDAFFNAWTGDLSFRQGGFEKIREQYITSELDENFNVQDVVKYRTVKVSGYALYLSLNEKGEYFRNQLKDKGILTTDVQKHRLLFSPPVRMSVTDTSMALYTGRYIPNMMVDSVSSGFWTMNYTPIQFQLDSSSTNVLYGQFGFPLDKIVRDNIEVKPKSRK